MGSKFETRLLGELCHEITVGFVGTMTNEYIESGIPFLRSKNIDEYDVKWDDMKYVSSEFHKKLSKSALKPGDVAIVRTGKPGTTCVIPNDLREANCSDIVIARVNNELLCPHYLSYFMNAMAHGQVNAHIVGAVQQHFNVSSAKKLEIPLPSRDKQAQIIHVLKTLDDKLKLNSQINQTLEQMAQTLFKSWFVDFDPVIDNALDAGFFEQDLAFSEELLRRVELRKAARESDDLKPLPEDIRQLFPDAFEECTESAFGLGGWVPKSWYYSSIYESMDIIFGAPFKSNLFNDLGEGKPIIRIRDLKTGTPQVFSVELHPKKTQIIAGDIIVGMDAEFRATIWSGDDAYLNQRLFLAKPKGTNISNLFVKYSLSPLLAIEEMAQVGTTVAHLGKKDIDKFNIILPNSSVLEAYKKQSDDFLRKIVVGMRENNTLTKLRDTLLPKLISGELSLDDIKIDIPEETLI
ncbi:MULTISPECIES: restriction endonuclease subunit S [Providencia]|uniref:restriction endonuclease subunit S n=1 Tax=Providencia TaxID=586 RepID=UPI00140AFB0E|nr:restriction endonuclease subunit S [Providencia sp. M-27]